MGFYTNPAAAAQGILASSAQSANFTAAANTIYTVSASGGAITVTLPTSAAGQTIVVRKTDASANTVTLSGTINGTSTTYAMTKQYQSKQLYNDGGTGWTIVAGDNDLTAIAATASTTGFLNAVGASKLTIGTVAPTSPAVGDLWIDTN